MVVSCLRTDSDIARWRTGHETAGYRSSNEVRLRRCSPAWARHFQKRITAMEGSGRSREKTLVKRSWRKRTEEQCSIRQASEAVARTRLLARPGGVRLHRQWSSRNGCSLSICQAQGWKDRLEFAIASQNTTHVHWHVDRRQPRVAKMNSQNRFNLGLMQTTSLASTKCRPSQTKLTPLAPSRSVQPSSESPLLRRPPRTSPSPLRNSLLVQWCALMHSGCHMVG